MFNGMPLKSLTVSREECHEECKGSKIAHHHTIQKMFKRRPPSEEVRNEGSTSTINEDVMVKTIPWPRDAKTTRLYLVGSRHS